MTLLLDKSVRINYNVTNVICVTMYQPEVNDYVIWKRKNCDLIDEGWVYFKGDIIPSKKGFKDNPRYITIETSIREKPVCTTSDKFRQKHNTLRHKYIHTLLLCNDANWGELKYVKSRKDAHSTEYFQREI